MLMRVEGDFPDFAVHLFRTLYQFLERGSGKIRFLCALLDRANGVFNQNSGILCRLRRLPCEVPYLIRDNGEALSGFSRSCGFYCGIQRQDIGLECDIIDGFNDVTDLLCRSVDLIHGKAQRVHFLTAFL